MRCTRRDIRRITWRSGTSRRGTIFTGDLVVQGSSVMIHWSRGGDLGQYLASLERLLALEPRRLLPAHGPAIDDPRAVLTGYLEHRRQRERQVVDALRAGHATVQAIAESIYDGLDPALMAAAQENVRAHLEKLKQRRARDRRRATLAAVARFWPPPDRSIRWTTSSISSTSTASAISTS